MNDDVYFVLGIIGAFVALISFVCSPYWRRVLAAEKQREESEEKSNLELEKLRHEQQQQFERERLAL